MLARWGAALCAALLVAVSCSSAPAPENAVATSDWPMFRGDLARDGHPEGATLTARRAASLRVLWTVTPGGAIDGTPVVLGRDVIAGTANGKLAAVDLRGGAPLWVVDGLGKITGTPAVSAGIVVVGTTTGDVVAVRLADGHRLWDWQAPGDAPAIWASPAVTAGTVLVGVASPYGDIPHQQGRVVALELTTGREKWSLETTGGGGVWSSVAVDAEGRGYVGVGNPDDGVLAFAVATGERLWSVSFHPDDGRDLDVGATPVIAEVGGREAVGVGSNGGVFEMLDAGTGAVIWSRFLVPGSAVHGLIASPAYDGGSLYVPSASAPVGMMALDPATGAFQWQQLTDLPIYSAPAVGVDVVVFGTGDVFGDANAGGLIALSTKNGSVVWKRDMSSAVFSAPAIVGDVVLAGDARGDLVALAA